jgi:hypothetical protein
MPSIIRRMRTREPTCLSIGFGVFLAITIPYDFIAYRNGTNNAPGAIDGTSLKTQEVRCSSSLILILQELFASWAK